MSAQPQPDSLAAARHARQQVEAALDKLRVDAARARVVRRAQVVADAQALRARVAVALARVERELGEELEPGMDEWRAHALLTDAVARALEALAGAAGAEPHQRALARAVRPRRVLTVSEWADRHRVLKTGTSNPGPWRTALVPYTREIMDALSTHDPCRDVVVMKASQVAGTEIALNWLGYVVEHAPAEAMLVMPTLELRNRFVKRRLRPMTRDTESLREVLGGQRSRDADTGMDLLSFPGGSLILAGANSPNSLRSDAVRYVVLDEVDGFEWEVGAEGDPLGLIENRQRTYTRRKTLMVSTPTVRGASRIEQRYLASDRRRYHVPCPDCGAMQPLIFANLKWRTMALAPAPGEAERPVVRAAWYECAECGAHIEEHHKQAMLAAGRWVAEVPGAPVRGYHISALYAPLGLGLRWAEVAQKWLDAQEDTGRLKVFVNTYLGETWEDARRKKTEARDLAQRAEPYRLRTAPRDCLLITAGVDVQDDRLAVQLVGFGSGRRWWTVDWSEPPGDPALEAVWEALLELLAAPIQHAGGATLRVRALGVDIGGHHTEEVKRFVDRAGQALRIPVMAIQGSRHRQSAVLPRRPQWQELTRSGRSVKRGVPVWQVGTEVAKDRLYNDLAADADLPPAERRAHFPDDLPPEFYDQLTAETYNPVRHRYELRRGRRNEALDCFDAETDVLTRAGWRRFADVTEADLLATVDLATDVIEYQAPQALIRRRYQGEMVELKGARIDVLVTPNHRMVTLKKKQVTGDSGARRWIFDVAPEITLAKDLTVHHAIKLRATWHGDESPTATVPASVSRQGRQIEPARALDAGDLAEMIGWWVAEGSLFAGRSRTQGNLRHVVQIAQLKPAPRAALKALLDRLPWRWREEPCGLRCTSKQLYAYLHRLGQRQPERCVPQWIKDASPAVIARFVDGAMAGDGWTQRKKAHHRTSRAYATTSARLADDMQELFIKLGLAATMRVVQPKPWRIEGRSGKTARVQYHVYDRGVSRAYLDGGGQGKRGFFGRRVAYDGMVYCATVPNGTLIVRRGGKTFIAGNCWVYAYAAAHHPLIRVDKMNAAQWDALARGLHVDVPAPAGGQTPPPAASRRSAPPPPAPRGLAPDDWTFR